MQALRALSHLRIGKHGFSLHNSSFRDALSLWYNWSLENSPSHCSSGHPFTVEHHLLCPTGGFLSIRHNEVRDNTASLLSEVCHGVSTELNMQPLLGESMSHHSAITDNGVRLDNGVHGFWGGRFGKSYFDIRVLNPCA